MAARRSTPRSPRSTRAAGARAPRCVYLEPWHADIEEFLELRDNTGDDAAPHAQPEPGQLDPGPVHAPGRGRRGRGRCSTPSDVPELPDLWGDEFDAAYRAAEADGPGVVRQVKARDLYARMMRTLAQTGNGWMTFKDAVQPHRATRPARPGNVVHLSNLCTEIIEVTSRRRDRGLQPRLDQPRRSTSPRRRRSTSSKLARDGAHRGAVPRPRDRHQLLPDRARRRRRTRAGARSGSGVMGLQDVFFQLRLPFDSAEARAAVDADRRRRSTSPRCEASAELAERARRRTRLRRDPGGAAASCSSTSGASTPTQTERWDALRARIAEHGLRNSLLDRDRPDRDHRLDRRLLRVHRAAGLQPVQARDAVRASSSRSTATWSRAEGAAACGPTQIRDRDQAGRGLGAGHRGAARGRARSCSAPPGSCRSGR